MVMVWMDRSSGSSGWTGSSTCSRIKAARPSSGWRGSRQAGGRGSSENSVYVAFLKSRRSFTGLGEHHWWKYMHWGQMFERLTKSNQSRRIVFLSSRQECVSSSEDDQETHVVWIGGEALSQERCLLASIWQEDCNLPQVAAYIHSPYFFGPYFGKSTF